MNGAPSASNVAAQWVEKAEHDLRNAEHTLTLAVNCPYDTVCFHAHQCVEKYFKAALTASGSSVPRTHDLTELHAMLLHEIGAAHNLAHSSGNFDGSYGIISRLGLPRPRITGPHRVRVELCHQNRNCILMGRNWHSV